MSKGTAELLARIEAPHFTAGIVLVHDRVIDAAPIVAYMMGKGGKIGWRRDQVRDYCQAKGWKIRVVKASESADETSSQVK